MTQDDGLTSRKLELCFKGSRDYLHGTDVYDAVAALSRAQLGTGVCHLRLAIHKFFRNQPELVWGTGALPAKRPANAVAEFSAIGEAKVAGWLTETGNAVTCRIAYDEEAIAACCRLAGDGITAWREPPGRPVEVLVAMTKQLHQFLYPVSRGARWIFTRLDLNRLLEHDDPPQFSLRLVDNLHGRITRTEIKSGVQTIGYIFFSLVAQ